MYYTEEQMIYDEMFKCHFNKKLADWAISKMGKRNATTKEMEPIRKRTTEEWDEFMKTNKLEIPEECYYDGYYLWHMAMADYPKTLDDAKRVASYIEETICDPDGDPTNTLICFVAKMDNMGIPIYWERFI